MRVYDRVLLDHVALVTRAAAFAARCHSSQRRKGADREPYLNHLAEVAELVATTAEEPDAELVAAGWLHDAVEDAGVRRDDIARMFGLRAAEFVAEVTDDKSLPQAERKRLQVEKAPLKSPGAKAIKIADKISNLRALVLSPPANWNRERRINYVDWACEVVAGCRGTNVSLELLFDEAVARAREDI